MKLDKIRNKRFKKNAFFQNCLQIFQNQCQFEKSLTLKLILNKLNLDNPS